MKEQQLTRSLAFLSLGLGAAELFAPRKVAELIGVPDDNERTIQMLGLREIAAGLGLMQGKPAYFLWSRVAGDVMDLGLLAAALNSERSDRRRVNYAIAAVVGVTLVDILASVLVTRNPAEPDWRDDRPMESRGGMRFEDPEAMRASADEAMSRYQSGHVFREDGAPREQEAGYAPAATQRQESDVDR